MFIGQDHHFMAEAITLAEKGMFTTMPNPRVGCVLVKQGQIIGRGWHQKAGEAHAEINAIADAQDQTHGATAYVTLEPCSHTGKTGPCSRALIRAGVARVVVAMEDPNPQVAGSGIKQLREAGIDVAVGLMAEQARGLNPGFVQRMESGRPWIRSKIAMSLDGRTAMASGESQWISSEQSRRDVQRWRARSCAILTGMGTVQQDRPHLTLREQQLGFPPSRQPWRIVLDSKGQFTPEMMDVNEAPLLLIQGEEHIGTLGQPIQLQACPLGADGLDLLAMSQLLAQHHFNEVLVEAGARLNGALLQAGLVDELIIYMAPHLMGDSGKGLFHLPGLQQMQDRVALNITDIRAVGEDWRISAKPVYQ